MSYTIEQKDTVKRCVERYLEICDSAKNKRNETFWTDPKVSWNRDMWRGCPKEASKGKIPYTVAFDNSLMSVAMDIDLRDYYTEPYLHLVTQLRNADYHFTQWHDNHYFTKEVFIWFGVVTELSLFGPELVYFPHREPWIKAPVIESEEDIERIGEIDFFENPSMKRIHMYYEQISELVDGQLKVMFPSWVRGPFCIAAHLVGLEEMMCYMLTEPEFVHKLMRWVTDTIKNWTTARNKFTGDSLSPGMLYNDEVGVPSISPELYKEFILPYEIELSEFYGGIRYWHSCGNTTDIMEHIAKIPNLALFHVSPWADERVAAKIFAPKGTALDVCLDPERDLYMANDDQIRHRLCELRENLSGVRWSPRYDAIQPRGEAAYCLETVKRADRLSMEIFGE